MGDKHVVVAAGCACGPEHTIVVDDAGRVFVSGRGTYGRLALNDETDRHALTHVESTLRIYNLEGKAMDHEDVNEVIDWPAKGARVVEVAGGGLGSAFRDDEGRVYTCGWGGYGRLGLGETTLQETDIESKSQARCLSPARVLFVLSAPQSRWGAVNALFKRVLEDYFVVGFRAMAMGRYHTVFVDHEGFCYSCGLGARGQLGQGPRDPCSVAKRVSHVTSIKGVACGDAHTVFVGDSGQVFACGKSDEGQLGVHIDRREEEGKEDKQDDGTAYDVLEPVPLPSIADKWITHVACGAYHTLLLDATGKAWGCGKGDCGQIGQNSTHNVMLPAHIPMPRGEKVVAIAAGDSHSLFVCESGEVYGCGDNEHFQLGLGDAAHNLNSHISEVVANAVGSGGGGGSAAGGGGGGKKAKARDDERKGGRGLLEEGEHPYWDGIAHGSVEARDCDVHRPTRMLLPHAVRVVQAAAGRRHSVMVDDQGGLWVCGSGMFGELCCGDVTVLPAPTLVPRTGKKPTFALPEQPVPNVQSRSARSKSKDIVFESEAGSSVFDQDDAPKPRAKKAEGKDAKEKKKGKKEGKEVKEVKEAKAAPLPQNEAPPLFGEASEAKGEGEGEGKGDEHSVQPKEGEEEDKDNAQARVHVLADGSLVQAFTAGEDLKEDEKEDEDEEEAVVVPKEHPLG